MKGSSTPALGCGNIYFVAGFNWQPRTYLGFFPPYFERLWLRSFTPWVSSVPRMIEYLIPGRSLGPPPLIKTTECSWSYAPHRECKLQPQNHSLNGRVQLYEAQSSAFLASLYTLACIRLSSVDFLQGLAFWIFPVLTFVAFLRVG